MKRASKHIVEK